MTARTSYYSPWSDSASSSEEESLLLGESRALRLKVHYDNTGAQPDQLVRCHVEAARIGFRGYGVMQVEIGLPPGADVALDSLGYAPAHEILLQPESTRVWLTHCGGEGGNHVLQGRHLVVDGAGWDNALASE